MPAATFRNPHRLPSKTCAACQRLFTWRKKWAKDWSQVKYCSNTCRNRGVTTP